MREYDFLPYRNAIEKMAREYKNITPIKPSYIMDKPNKEDDLSNFYKLENTYCYNVEIVILLKNLSKCAMDKEIIDVIEDIISNKNITIDKLNKIYYEKAHTSPPSPICSRLILPKLLRRVISLQSKILYNLEKINNNYYNIENLINYEIKNSLLINNLIILITCI